MSTALQTLDTPNQRPPEKVIQAFNAISRQYGETKANELFAEVFATLRDEHITAAIALANQIVTETQECLAELAEREHTRVFLVNVARDFGLPPHA